MTTNSEASSQHLSAPMAAKEKSEISALPTAPYGATLRSDEFRLIFLESVKTPDSPVHLKLEVYNLDDCPEYEAVSYTWAGENGDNTLSQPIYVGPFWDILLQTNNCWAMLRFMRPLRLPRMIWVDAICINQGNTLERSMQVANMGNIYSACSRVVVYLGPDIAMSLFDRHPRRRRLHEFETGETKPCFPNNCDGSPSSPSNLHDIFRLRYFSRIWVIQELLLSQRVVIRIGDVDFWADPAMATHFSLKVSGWDWRTTAATWVQFTSQGTSRERNLRELLEMSSASRATDPRDRIFGLLGILPELKSQKSSQRPEINDSLLNIKEEVQADYSLSCQQTFIGLFAYCLLNRNQPNILYHASCLSRRKPNYPTWAPNWASATTWMILFLEPRLTSADLFERIKDLTENRRAEGWEGFLFSNGLEFDIYELRGPGRRYIGEERHWRKGAFINASTASLNINLTQYMVISRTLERFGTISGLHLFRMRYEYFSVYIVSEERLDRVLTGKGNEELFILNIDDYLFIYLLLRRHMDEHGAVTYKLISACPRVQILMFTQRSANEITTMRELQLRDLQYSVYDIIGNCREILDNEFRNHLLERWDTGILVGIRAIRDLVPVLEQLYAQLPHQNMSVHWSYAINAGNRRLLHTIGKTFIQCVDQKFSPQFNGKDVTISVSTSWVEICRIYLFRRTEKHISDDQHRIWKYRIKDSEYAWESPYISPSAYDNLLNSSVERWKSGSQCRGLLIF